MIPQLGLYDFSATGSERIVRFPLFSELTENDVELVCVGVKQFYK